MIMIVFFKIIINDNDNDNDTDTDNDNNYIYAGSPLALAVFSGALHIVIIN